MTPHIAALAGERYDVLIINLETNIVDGIAFFNMTHQTAQDHARWLQPCLKNNFVAMTVLGGSVSKGDKLCPAPTQN